MITNCLIGEPNLAAMAELAKGINLSVIVESGLALSRSRPPQPQLDQAYGSWSTAIWGCIAQVFPTQKVCSS